MFLKDTSNTSICNVALPAFREFTESKSDALSFAHGSGDTIVTRQTSHFYIYIYIYIYIFIFIFIFFFCDFDDNMKI